MLRNKENKGFTLIELLIVVTIIGILATITIPGYIGMSIREMKKEQTFESAFTKFCNKEQLNALEQKMIVKKHNTSWKRFTNQEDICMSDLIIVQKKEIDQRQIKSGLKIQHCIDAYCIDDKKYIKNGQVLTELVDENGVGLPCEDF